MTVLHDWIPFNTARATHTNLLVVWLLAGFMGSAYYIIPDESQTDIWSMKLGWVQWGSLVVVGVIAVIGLPLQLVGGPQVPRDPASA
jgi:nitric oxide reductase subunit B